MPATTDEEAAMPANPDNRYPSDDAVLRVDEPQVLPPFVERNTSLLK